MVHEILAGHSVCTSWGEYCRIGGSLWFVCLVSALASEHTMAQSIPAGPPRAWGSPAPPPL